jgi:hypothetical protein
LPTRPATANSILQVDLVASEKLLSASHRDPEYNELETITEKGSDFEELFCFLK